MNYVSVENISKSYGELTLFSDISFGINKEQKIAFIAKNINFCAEFFRLLVFPGIFLSEVYSEVKYAKHANFK